MQEIREINELNSRFLALYGDIYEERESHPAWGAWIEMPYAIYPMCRHGSRTPHGVRGLKYLHP